MLSQEREGRRESGTGVAALTVSERGPSITQSRPTSDVTPSLAQLLTQPPARRSGGGGRFIVT